ncbi:MAG TPA: hypothetical protein VLM37_04410 [Fibrobacteraceae bacterium]|nr:hypothetical protein [Fibrobacteraceae bacterium]
MAIFLKIAFAFSFVGLVQAIELQQAKGHIDFWESEQMRWQPFPASHVWEPQEQIRLRTRSALTLSDEGIHLSWRGPAAFRLEQRPPLSLTTAVERNGVGPKSCDDTVSALSNRGALRWCREVHGEQQIEAKATRSIAVGANKKFPDLVISDWSGWLHYSVDPGHSVRLLCGDMAIQNIQGNGRGLCLPDSSLLLVWVSQGQVVAQRGENYGVTLQSGKIWSVRGQQESFLDSAQAEHWFIKWETPSNPTGDSLRVIWQRGPADLQERWDVGRFLREALRFSLSPEQAQEESRLNLYAHLENFSIQENDSLWTLGLIVDFSLEDSLPIRSIREFQFKKSWSVLNHPPNTLSFLRLLPLDAKNQRIAISVMGKAAQELRDSVAAQVLDPFWRELNMKPLPPNENDQR